VELSVGKGTINLHNSRQRTGKRHDLFCVFWRLFDILPALNKLQKTSWNPASALLIQQ